MNEISVEIDKTIKNDKIDVDIDKPHNGKQINMIEVSPNGSYLVTYSPEDDSIIGWNVKDIDDMDDMDGGQLKPEPNHHHIDNNVKLTQLSVSDDKEIAYICDNKLKMINMNNNQEIEFPYEKLCINYHYCTFFRTPFGFIQFIHCSDVKDRHGTDQKIIFIYPTRIKNKKLTCKGIYKIPENFELISLSKYGKVYLLSNNYVYAWDISTRTSIRIFVNEKDEECKRDSIEISSDIKFVCLRIKNKIIVYSFELEIPIASLNNDIQLYNFIKHTFHIGLFPLLFPLLNSGFRNSVMEYYWKKCLNRYQNDILPDIIQITTTGYAFGILDGDVWKIKISDELDNEIYDKIKTKILDSNAEETFENLNIYLFNPFLKNSLFREIISDSNRKEAIELNTNSTKWEIKITDGKLEFQISNNVWNLIYTSKFNVKVNYFYGSILLNDNNDILILSDIGIFIYHFNENNKSLCLIYFYYTNFDTNNVERWYPLPLPNYYSFKLSEEWVSYVKNNRESLLKCGAELLSYAIEEHNLELIDDIYIKCLNHFKQDLRNNKAFLRIIPLHKPEYYPEYISRFSLDTTMIIDSPFYSINSNLHLRSFQHLQMVDLTDSILWTDYNVLFHKIHENHKILYYILIIIQFLTFPIYLVYISPYLFITKLVGNNFINDFFKIDSPISFYLYIFVKIWVYISALTTQTKTPTVTFMIPYIKFVNYPRDYNWIYELIWPQSSPFVRTINEDIYKTWNGEALIDSKWNTYGKNYYIIIWILFMTLLGCFTAVATIPQQYINDDTRKNLLIASIVLGLIHLNYEIRQIIYDPINWIKDFWNYFDIIAYVLPVYTSIYWLQTDIKDVQLLSFSCLLLDIKFLLFLSVSESVGTYFAIIVIVAKRIFYFLIILFILIISFAHAFFILLSPDSDFSFEKRTNNNDPNNPWNLASTYSKVLDDGTIDSNPYIIQPPNENTNMFIDYRTAIFAVYLFLTGDSSSLINWTYMNNPSLVILIVLFSFLIVVYLMNLFIGLLNLEIDKSNDRVFLLIQKAKILAEIELFYLLPNQRRLEKWFPEVIYYCADVDITRAEVKTLITDGRWSNEFPDMNKDLFKKINIQRNPAEVDLRKLLEEVQSKLKNITYL
ncbi:hypothetical protein RhiirA1_453319 [Rhizophagus irregularis]|uniref:Ion transport domain-containing protein n=1 Tax=Rhizophagus irregularis TaxID=588596 RepID=A0A2N0S7W7_9GLOM|nr:hypothetical protein RhiirA1_453319 [Rhizophagus irregularis]